MRMETNHAPPPIWKDATTLAAVRPEVRKILESSPAYARLPRDEQLEIANNMVKVASCIANPNGLASQELSDKPGGGVLVHAQGPLAPPAPAGKDFKAGAVDAGVKGFDKMVKTVDFPKFVSGLIQGVFKAIVDSSIDQMKAYGTLLANVAKSVGEYANDNISMNNGRDWLAQKYPDAIKVEEGSGSGAFAVGDSPAPQPRITATGENPEEALRRISQDLQLAQPVTDISDEEQEARLVQAARLQMAKSRQQLLASMVMLGINRIVITDGLIKAKVHFHMEGKDVLSRGYTASTADRNELRTQTGVSASYGGWFSPVDASVSSEIDTLSVSTAESKSQENSASEAKVEADLYGEVKVNFKSDYFPMEKMANPQMIAAIQGNATPLDSGTYVAPGQRATT